MTVQYLRALHSADFPRGREKGGHWFRQRKPDWGEYASREPRVWEWRTVREQEAPEASRRLVPEHAPAGCYGPAPKDAGLLLLTGVGWRGQALETRLLLFQCLDCRVENANLKWESSPNPIKIPRHRSRKGCACSLLFPSPYHLCCCCCCCYYYIVTTALIRRNKERNSQVRCGVHTRTPALGVRVRIIRSWGLAQQWARLLKKHKNKARSNPTDHKQAHIPQYFGDTHKK